MKTCLVNEMKMDEEIMLDDISEPTTENVSLLSSAQSTDSPVKNVRNEDMNEIKPSNHNLTLQNINKHNKSDNKMNKNKYDFVQSKVKQYRLDIQRQNKLFENQNKLSETKIENNIQHYDYKNNIHDLDKLFKLLNEKDQTIIEKEHELSVLHNENKNLMVENVNLEMRMEFLRLELWRIKQQSEPKLSTPVGNKPLFMNAWKTPIKNNLLKTPTSNRKLSNTQSPYVSDVDYSDISDDFFLETNGNILNESKCEKTVHNTTTLCSNEPLIPKNKQFAKRAKRVFMNIITCDCESSRDITICSNTTEDQQIKRLTSFKKLKNVSKISPAIVTSILHTPNNPIKRSVSFSNAKTSVIPVVSFNAPTPDENLTPKNQTAFTKSAFQRRSKISTVSFQTTAMEKSTLKKNKYQLDEENLEGQDNLHVAATYLDDIIEKSQKIKNILERKL